MSNPQPYPTFSDFTELVENNSRPTENLDLVSEPSPVSQSGNNPPNIPQRVQTLETKVAGLERNVVWIRQNMATKQDMAELKNELKNDIAGIKTLIQNR